MCSGSVRKIGRRFQLNTSRRKLIPITAVGILTVIGYDEFFDCSQEDDANEGDDEEDAAYQANDSPRD